MDIPFEVAAGGTVGRDHRHALKNSHDSWHIEQRSDVLTAVVCDGCSSGAHSEVGAKLGSRIWTEAAFRELGRGWLPDHPDRMAKFLDRVEQSALSMIQVTADAMGRNVPETIGDYFLFTVLGAIVHPQIYVVFAAGDGVVLTTHEETEDGRYILESENNAPLYPAYRLIPKQKQLQVVKVVEIGLTSHLNSILIGTDGVTDLIESAEEPIPGKSDLIGSIDQFWKTDRFFKNPYAIGHRLNLINRTVSKVDYETRSKIEEHGPLTDDTTLAVIRRKP